MLSIPGTEALSPAVKYVIAFAIIFVLLALFALVLRRLTGGRLSLPSSERSRTRQPRVGIVDVYDLDRQRQLILLRRDNVEHLLLIGGPNDVIVETNIVRSPGARLTTPAVEQNDRPENLVDRSRESFPEPVVARLGSAEAVRTSMEQPARNMPAGVQTEPFLKPDVVALSSGAQPSPSRSSPQPTREPPPQPAPQRNAPPKTVPEPSVVRAMPEQPRQPAPRPPDPAMGDAAVLSNMAKQLEEALKRPLPAGKSGPSPASNGSFSEAEERPVRAASSPGRASQPIPMTPPANPEPRPRPVQTPSPTPAPASVTRMRPNQPPPEAANARSAPSSPPGGREGSDPFSVEEIEAEFARLLGRPPDRPH